MAKRPPAPTKISSRQRPIRMKDLPARIVIEDEDPENPFELRFSIEPYDVPEGGGEVREFGATKSKRKL